MKASELELLTPFTPMDLWTRDMFDHYQTNKRHWKLINSICPTCKGLHDPQEVFCSDECRVKYKGQI